MDNAFSSYKLSGKYDVLINFTGEDIRRKFVSHLNSAFSTVGLTTFLHHPNAVKSTHIQQPIHSHCRVAIVVFTQTYSQSAWCLHQLHHIINWHETYCRHVLPVYYEIQPSDVRLQKGDFGKAFKATAQQTFSEQELEHGMSRWSHALTKAANFFGWDESNHRSDAELVDKIVKSVVNLLVLSATKFPVGLQSRVEDLIRTIKNKSTEVCIVEICGDQGYGKTTLAKAIYNQIHWTFKKKSFIENISQVTGIRGYLRLLEQLVLDILKQKVEIPTIDVGRRMIRETLYGKSKGTVIIITTSDEDLRMNQPIDSIFRLERMNAEDSLELFSWHAFREPKPKDEYEDLARRVISYCRGVTLALEIVGSSLFEKTKEEWNSLLFKYLIIGWHRVPDIIKVSIEESGISKQHFRCSLIGVGTYHQFFNAVSDNIYQVLSSSESYDVCLPAVDDPYCMAHMGEGHSVSFVVPEDGDMKGMILCVIYLSTPKIIEPQFTTVVIVNYTKCTFHIHNHGTAISFKDEDWHDIMSNLECGDNVEIFVNFGNGLVVKNTTVYLIWGEAENMEKVSEPKKQSLIRFIKKVVM
ncbi:disease resistance protein ADR2-like [Vigna radiata var. radiata]|uniref:Disease resistance protein ADR2-like n=1 Tax=Vigna radiata var. radiata TaxID=3916 RepID=A0A3Q0FCX6_VIGRR|nr:disease resistance protein ADR2-like [Vigna radiata var. radiata]